MWFYRRLLRISWTERRTNDSVLQELGRGKMLLSIITQRKLRYIGHAARNKSTHLMKTVLQGKINSQRKRGRPAASYVNSITKPLKMTLQTMTQNCQDRERWKDFVKSACSAATIATDDADR